jgi:hypothetical protein
VEKYERKIKINRELTTIDTNNDGIEDTITYLNKEDLFVSLILKQTIKDLGVYTDYKKEPEIIDLGNFWQTTNNGDGDGGTNPISGGLDNGYVGGETEQTEDGLEVYGCTDPNALNYNENATIDDGSCDSGGVVIEDPQEEDPEGGIVTSAGGGCFKLSSGYQPLSSIVNTYTPSYREQKASEWCRAIHPSCGGNYPIIPNCTPNGCPDNIGTCCPGPIDTHHLLTVNECQSFGVDCSGTDCSCQGSPNTIFGGVKYELLGPNVDGNYNIVWSFYCIPN